MEGPRYQLLLLYAPPPLVYNSEQQTNSWLSHSSTFSVSIVINYHHHIHLIYYHRNLCPVDSLSHVLLIFMIIIIVSFIGRSHRDSRALFLRPLLALGIVK